MKNRKVLYNVDTDLNMEVIKLPKETKKQRLQREEETKKEGKIQLPSEFRLYRKRGKKITPRSWERLYEEHGYDPKSKNQTRHTPKERVQRSVSC